MANFRRIKIEATVETATMLLTDDEIEGALQKFRDALGHLDLAVLSVEPKEEAPVRSQKSVDYWD